MNVEAPVFLDLVVVLVVWALLGLLPAICIAAGVVIGRRTR